MTRMMVHFSLFLVLGVNENKTPAQMQPFYGNPCAQTQLNWRKTEIQLVTGSALITHLIIGPRTLIEFN